MGLTSSIGRDDVTCRKHVGGGSESPEIHLVILAGPDPDGQVSTATRIT
jgi:hypothetical protein